MKTTGALDTVIRKDKKFLAQHREEEFVWTLNFKRALKMTKSAAEKMLEQYGENELANAYMAKDVLQEYPFNAVIRIKHMDMVLYVRKVTKEKIIFCHTIQNAYHFKDDVSAQKTLSKYKSLLSHSDYFPEVIIDE